MIWSAQLEVVPTSLLLSTFRFIFLKKNLKFVVFSENMAGMLTVLSDDCRLIVGYLGTEPSLFRMPLTETRFIDFEVS